MTIVATITRSAAAARAFVAYTGVLACLGASLPACDRSPAGVPQPHLLYVDSVYWTERWTDSVRVEIAYALSACEDVDRVEMMQVGDTLDVTIVGRALAACGVRHSLATTAVVRVPMASPFYVIANQPGGWARRYSFAGFPPMDGCRLAPFYIAGWNAGFTVESDSPITIVRSACYQAPWPPHVTWSIADTTIATITPVSDSSALLRAKRVGSTTMTVEQIGEWKTWGALNVVAAP